MCARAYICVGARAWEATSGKYEQIASLGKLSVYYISLYLDLTKNVVCFLFVLLCFCFVFVFLFFLHITVNFCALYIEYTRLRVAHTLHNTSKALCALSWLVTLRGFI